MTLVGGYQPTKYRYKDGTEYLQCHRNPTNPADTWVIVFVESPQKSALDKIPLGQHRLSRRVEETYLINDHTYADQGEKYF